MKKLLLSVVALFAMSAQNAFAINLTFQFDVNSSGPSIYACNAGLKHPSGRACFDRVEGIACTPGCADGNLTQCTAGTTPKTCVCTGEDFGNGTQGAYRLDFLKSSTADWTDNQEAMGTVTQKMIEAGLTNFNQIHAGAFPVLESYKKQLKDLTVNLGSEMYGAEYFVDICYRGPQIDYTNSVGYPNSTLNFAFKANATVFDIKKIDGVTVTDSNYKGLAGLQVKAELKCIMNNKFDYCLADVLPGETAGCAPGTPQVASAHNLSYPSVEKWIDMGKTAIQEANIIALSTMVANGQVTPRFCQIRYSFREKNTAAMRKWKLQQARICTYTEITEPAQ